MIRPYTRRELIQRGAFGAAVFALPGFAAACGGSDSESAGTTGGELNDVLNFSNWPYYMDVKGKKHPTLDQFQAKTGIKVNYYEDVDTNDGYFAKVQGRLSKGQGIDRDIFVATDNSRFPALYVDQKWVQELDKDLIPNFANLIDAQQSPPFDPDRTYSLPWLSGMDGIAWNQKLTGPVTSITQLFEDPKLKGKVGIFKEMADTIGLVMLDNGDDPAKVTDASFNRAIERVQAAFDSGQVRRAYGNDYVQPLATGNLVATIAWGGDVASALPDNPHLRWELPEQGRDHLDGQHVHPARRQRADRLHLHELRLRPEDRGAGRRRDELHLGRQGRQGGGAQARPSRREQPAGLPERRDAVEGPLQRPEDGQQRRLRHEVAAGPGRVAAWARSSIGTREARPTCC